MVMDHYERRTKRKAGEEQGDRNTFTIVQNIEDILRRNRDVEHAHPNSPKVQICIPGTILFVQRVLTVYVLEQPNIWNNEDKVQGLLLKDKDHVELSIYNHSQLIYLMSYLI